MTLSENPHNHSHLRKCSVTQRWVVIHPGRAELPLPDWRSPPSGLSAEACPFCPGKEIEAGPEIYVEREPGSPANGQGWWVRVLADRYPILHIEGELGKTAEGMYDSMNAIGAHEILIETPEHDRHWAHLEILQLERVLRACQQRSLDLRNDVRFRSLIWVKNHNLPTSLIHHPHSHIVAAPFVPRVIEEELKGFADHMRRKERCVLCDMVRQEIGIGRRVILREGSMVVCPPFAPRFAHECWIVPVEHRHDFAAVPSSDLRDLARALHGILVRIFRLLNDPPYTLVLHTSPLGEFAREEYHWHLELVPHPFQALGLEWGTGIYINPVLPEVAADRLRGAVE
jgi:UDPglucose--hexose-1-phosphate uridylyltransferase